MSQTSRARRFGLLGRTLGHSYSPQIHERLGSVPYDLVELPDEASVRAFFDRMRSGEGGLSGVNVTIPYKRVAFSCADELSDAARRLGNVNTVVARADGTLFGDNTDYHGFSRLVRSCGVDPAGLTCLVLGDGGAASTARAALADMGAAEVLTACRRGPLTFDALAADEGLRARVGLIANCTPVGMHPHEADAPLVDPADFPSLACVVDMVYNPLRTRLVQRARELGVPCAGGLLMLVAQAKRSSDEFLGASRPDSVEDEVVAAVLRELACLSVIGMPGSGKTTMGRRLERLRGMGRVDVDELIEARAGMHPSRVIAERGEDAFRQVETACTAEATSAPGRVVTCGGGVVTRPENLAWLRQNGPVMLLTRGLSADDGECLSTAGRPLSQAIGVERLRQERGPLYRAWADFSVGPDTPDDDLLALVDDALANWHALRAADPA